MSRSIVIRFITRTVKMMPSKFAYSLLGVQIMLFGVPPKNEHFAVAKVFYYSKTS